MKFSIRDLLLLTAVAALATGWIVEHLANSSALAAVESRVRADCEKEHKANDLENMSALHKLLTEKAKVREDLLKKELEAARKGHDG